MPSQVETGSSLIGSIRRQEIDSSIVTNNDVSHYLHVFGYGMEGEGLRGKVILDVGSGESNFAQVVNKTGLATVVALDPKAISPPSERVKGIAQTLPFKDGVFDEVLSSYCLWGIKTGLDWAVAEMLRVTKSGGKVKIYPVILSPSPDSILYYYETPPHIKLIERKRPHFTLEPTLELTKDPSITGAKWKKDLNLLHQSIIIISPCAPFGLFTSGINL